MSKKSIFITFISTIMVVLVVGVLSFWVWSNQPSADVASPPSPAEPTRASADKPPVPAEPRISGDAIDDGVVDSLDVNAEVVHWGETNFDYNLVDSTDGTKNVIDILDIAQTFKYWHCYEGRADKGCPYK